MAEQKQVWTYQDNYGQWRWQAYDGEQTLASQRGYSSREEAVASHELAGLTREAGYHVMADGATMGAAKVPLPRIDVEAEAASAGVQPPRRPDAAPLATEGPMEGPRAPGLESDDETLTPRGVRPVMVDA